jgi:hypothetical protein
MVTVNVIVYDFQGTLVPDDNFTGRSQTDYGLEEIIVLGCNITPGGLTASQVGGLRWSEGLGKGSLSNITNNGTANYDASAYPGTANLYLTVQSGPSREYFKNYIRIIVEPSGTRMTRVNPNNVWHIQWTASAGIKLYYWLDPTNVSFKYLTFGEGSCPATSAWGIFSTQGPHPQNTFGEIMGGNIVMGCRVSGEDHAWVQVIPWDAGDGGFVWSIPTQYIDDTGTRNTFGSTQNHVPQVWSNGNATQSKGGHS